MNNKEQRKKKKIENKQMYTDKFNMLHKIKFNVQVIDNDPSAGSPTETLLRLLLPLDNLVCKF